MKRDNIEIGFLVAFLIVCIEILNDILRVYITSYTIFLGKISLAAVLLIVLLKCRK